ncbi:hypothetical protein OG558_34110 [Kribbella sp. NBC_01510]|uniref:hypothetical protein n=1 Tax=Kribbella sp. NBC_01510 TaxID=2903581 RepID=UPI00386DE61E
MGAALIDPRSVEELDARGWAGTSEVQVGDGIYTGGSLNGCDEFVKRDFAPASKRG